MLNISFEYEKMSDEFDKYHIRGLPIQMALHHFKGPDRYLPHDHPASFSREILSGWYTEEKYWTGIDGKIHSSIDQLNKGYSSHVRAQDIHRIVDVAPQGCWTVVIVEPWVGEWSWYDFNCVDGPYRRQWNKGEWVKV